MIAWEDDFDELSARVLFGRNELTLSWGLGEPMPEALVVDALTLDLVLGAVEDAPFLHLRSLPELFEASLARAGRLLISFMSCSVSVTVMTLSSHGYGES